MIRETVGGPMEVLLVEDSLTEARLTAGVLKKAVRRHRLTLIRDGQEALGFLRQEGRFARAPRPHLILLDLGLPGLDGRELLGILKADLELSDIPVIVMTASQDESDAVHSRMLNVEAHLVKPIDSSRFIEVVLQLNRFWREDLILPRP